jgi:hypothetical protein
MSRPDLDHFVVGELYEHSESGEVVEFVGIAPGTELDGQDVGVFRNIEAGYLLLATSRGFNFGETFRPAGDAMADEALFPDPPT